MVACAGAQSTASGRVIGITDGDTFTLLDADKRRLKIRLNGPDAPEHDQDFGRVSKDYLSELIFGKVVTVSWRKVDRNHRPVAIVSLGSTDVGLDLLRAGLAWYFTRYERDVPVSKRGLYADAEKEARAAKRGLWQQPNPVPPWEWRAQKRGNNSTARPVVPVPRAGSGRVIGNRNSMIYHFPACPDYGKVSEKNRVYFADAQEAEKAGYRRARNCPAR